MTETETEDTDTHTQRWAHYCSECQMTVRVFTTDDGPRVGCMSDCHNRTLDEFAAGDLPEAWGLEDTPFNW